MHAVAAYTRHAQQHRFCSPAGVDAYLRAPKGRAEPPRRMTRRRRVSSSRHRGFTTYTVQPAQPRQHAPGSVVYIHGGANVSQIDPAHWRLVSDIADACSRPVHVPLYGLAPDHTAIQAHDFLQDLLTDVSALGPTYLVGDSSGGGLALTASQFQVRAGHVPLGLTLVSPWLDIALRDPVIETIAPHDPWLVPAGLRRIGRCWSADLDLDDPRVSPLLGDLTGLPPIDLFTGTRDILHPDSLSLRDRLPPGAVRYYKEPGALHVYPISPTPEGRRARRLLTRHIAEAFAPAV
jgi:acetyl esterase/lipase